MELRIILNQETKGIVFSGQQLTGVVEVECPRDTLLQKVVIELLGKQRTQLHKISKSNRRLTLEEESELVNDVQCLWMGHTFSQGRTIIPFKFTVPHYLPPSFEGEYGFTRYLLQLKVVRPQPFVDQFVVRPLSITSMYDLKSLPYTSYRTQRTINQKIDHLLNKGRLKVMIKLRKSGFVCGEKIEIYADIDNSSPLTVLGIKTTLRQHVSHFYYDEYDDYNRRRMSESTQDVIVCDQHYLVEKDSESIYRGKSSQIPPVAPSHRSKLIYVDYDIKFEIYLENNVSATAFIPIIIGNLPCHRSIDSPTVAFHRIDRLTPPDPSTPTSLLNENVIHLEQKAGKRSNIKDALYNIKRQFLSPLTLYYDNM
ncbi:unnamed protein product [Bursaphelenchus okinawaensis]|uniref:Arrestin C-terminal-like domain-containing protein n=1 Tax=Bursaphelenchus okinawaensis TaxID=465554 RepID=A0A811KF14_9BILA|nr:unnamed protein product [Bursaphelenchus okinawaensis]CAG9103403.1 unnamed protein product [Bursaphelenchus okinawaensis]